MAMALDSSQDAVNAALNQHRLYLGTLSDILRYDLDDCIKLSGNRRSLIIEQKPGLSNATKAVKDKLEADPHNLALLSELGRQYTLEGRWQLCGNVMMRGWKRAASDEVTDPTAKFKYLMRICECSFFSEKFRQADAILRDIEEPSDPQLKLPYLLLSIKIYAALKDSNKALGAFKKAIELGNHGYPLASRVWCLTNKDLWEVNSYEAATSAVQNLAEKEVDKRQFTNLETACNPREREESRQKYATPLEKHPTLVKAGFAASGGLSIILLLYFLWVLEAWSLQKMKFGTE